MSGHTPSDKHAARWAVDPLLEAIAQALIALREPTATPDELQRLQREGLLDVAEQGGLSVRQLADSIREWRRSGAAVEPASGPQEVTEGAQEPEPLPQPQIIPLGGPLPNEPTLARQHAVSRVLAASLAEDLTIWEPITRFRREHLSGTLLAWKAVERWVAERKESDGPPSYWLSEVPISQEQIARGRETAPVGHTTLSVTVTVPLPSSPQDDGNSGIGMLEQRLLEYLVPHRVNPTWTFVAAGGVLDALRQISENLAPAHPHDPQADSTLRPWWTRAQATTFVLTGLAPFVTGYKAIDLDFDPTVPLDQIVEQVAQARRALVGERARELSPKHLHLAVFSAERPDEPWQARQEAWNTIYPQWAYPGKQKSNFIRDSLAAKRRLLLQDHE